MWWTFVSHYAAKPYLIGRLSGDTDDTPGTTLQKMRYYLAQFALAPVLLTIYIGGTCVLLRQFDPKLMWEITEQEKLTVNLAVPAMLNFMLMVPDFENTAAYGTAFTVSIEAREGVSTGISAADRALTIATAINEQKSAADIATPGHVFPLRARKGGVLVRAGHTEAAVDLTRMAGLPAVGMIVELVHDDGTMQRGPALRAFAWSLSHNSADADDLVNPPILVAPPPEAGDKTHWRIRGQNGTIVEVPHDLASAGPFCVAVPRTVIDSGRLMAIQEGGCLLKILPEGYAILTGDEGSEAVFDLPAVPADLDLPPTMQPVATATTTARQLTDAIFMCGRFPVGFNPHGPAPYMEFAIEEDAVSFGANWRRYGRANCTYRAPARTSGTTTVGLLCATVRYLLTDATGRDENVTVSVFGDWVCFESESWKAWAPRVEVGAARCLVQLLERP